MLEEELTVHLSVPGDTILINNRPGPREPPPYQEPRPRGNPPHSAPNVPNGSGKTFLVPVPPPSSACLLSVSFFLSFTIPFFYCLPQFQLILFLCVPGHSLLCYSTSFTISSPSGSFHALLTVPSALILFLCPTHIPLSSLLCPLIVSFWLLSSLLNSPCSFHPSTYIYISIHHSSICLFIHPYIFIRPFVHPSSIHQPCIHPSSIHAFTIHPSIHHPSIICSSIHHLSIQLSSTLQMLVLFHFCLLVHLFSSALVLPYSVSPCLALSLIPSPCFPPSFSRQRCCSPIQPTVSFWPLTPAPLEARAPPHPPGPNPPTPRVSPSAPSLCQAPHTSTGAGKSPHTLHSLLSPLWPLLLS